MCGLISSGRPSPIWVDLPTTNDPPAFGSYFSARTTIYLAGVFCKDAFRCRQRRTNDSEQKRTAPQLGAEQAFGQRFLPLRSQDPIVLLLLGEIKKEASLVSGFVREPRRCVYFVSILRQMFLSFPATLEIRFARSFIKVKTLSTSKSWFQTHSSRYHRCAMHIFARLQELDVRRGEHCGDLRDSRAQRLTKDPGIRGLYKEESRRIWPEVLARFFLVRLLEAGITVMCQDIMINVFQSTWSHVDN